MDAGRLALERHPGLVWAFVLGAGPAREVSAMLDESTLMTQDEDGTWVWLHFDLADARVGDTLRRLIVHCLPEGEALAEDVFEALLRAPTEACFDVEGRWLQGALYDRVLDMSQATNEQALLTLALTRRLAVTGRRHHLEGVEQLRSLARSGRLGAQPGDLLLHLLRREIDGQGCALFRVLSDLDRIEDAVLSERHDLDRRHLLQVQRELVHVHRHLASQARLMSPLVQESWRTVIEPLVDLGDCRAGLQALADLDGECLGALDRARMLKDEVSDQLTSQTNRQLYVLSLLTAALMPPGIVVGVFGMNTGGLPLVGRSDGFPLALWIALLSSLGVVAALLIHGHLTRRSVRGPGLELRRQSSASSSKHEPTP